MGMGLRGFGRIPGLLGRRLGDPGAKRGEFRGAGRQNGRRRGGFRGGESGPPAAGQKVLARAVPAVTLDAGQAERGRFERGDPTTRRMEGELG